MNTLFCQKDFCSNVNSYNHIDSEILKNLNVKKNDCNKNSKVQKAESIDQRSTKLKIIPF